MRKDLAYESLTWEKWLSLWRNARTYEECDGLLHHGLTSEDGEMSVASVCFYLKLADGFHDRSLFEPGEKRDKQRSALSKKALSVLCQHFFRNSNKKGEQGHSWDLLIANPPVFRRVLWFFSLRGYWTTSNLPQQPDEGRMSFQEETLDKFLDDFFWLALTFHEFPQSGRYRTDSEEARDHRMYKMVIKLRPWLLEVMHGARRIDLLLKKTPYGKNPHPLDEASMAKLGELALVKDRDHLGQVSARYETLDEAIYAGARAATTYAICQVRQREGARQDKVREAQEALTVARRDLAKLGVTVTANA